MPKSAIGLKVGRSYTYWRTESDARAWFRSMHAQGGKVDKGAWGMLSAEVDGELVVGFLSVATYAPIAD